MINIPKNVADAPIAPTWVFVLSATTVPATELKPTSNVSAVSMAVKLPDTMCAHPSKNNQMSAISENQNRKQGSAVHLLHSEPRSAKTTDGQTGTVCTMWRRMPWDSMPTI